MKYILIITFSLLTSFGNECKEKFEIVKATSQNWFGGQARTGKGTYFELTIVPKVNSEKLKFDQLWIGSDFFEIQCYQKGKRIKNNTFGPGDTITITVNQTMKPEPLPFVEEETHESDPLPPFEFKGKALLSYTLNSKRKYKVIEEFTKLEDLLYP